MFYENQTQAALGLQTAHHWIGLSERGLLGPVAQQKSHLIRGLFVIELRLPLRDGAVILSHQSDAKGTSSFAVFHDAQSGISILQRDGARVSRHALIGRMPPGNGTARLTFRFDCPANKWDMKFQVLGHDSLQSAVGTGPLAIACSDIGAICTQAEKDASVMWFGFSQGALVPQSAPWIGPRTQVETSLGMVAAGNLRAGDIIMTADNGPKTLRAVRRFDSPACGSFAPVLLRAPYYGQKNDVLVSPDQQIAISGSSVEYLFSADTVLLAAKNAVDGRSAIADTRRTTVSAVVLDLGCAALIDTGGLLLAVGPEFGFDDPLHTLNRFEVATLMSMLGRAATYAA